MSGVCVNENIRVSLGMPMAKRFQIRAIKNGEDKLQVETIVINAVNIFSLDAKNHHVHSYPRTKDADGQTVELPRSLQKILGKHPFPLSQGPVILPTECKENMKNIAGVVEERTQFHHSDSQTCREWVPVKAGIDSWSQKISCSPPSYEARKLKTSTQGAASLRDMRIVYTCNFLQCLVHCPCSICNDKRENCRMRCKIEVCQNCNSQCTMHQVKLARMFQPGVDSFTMVTRCMEQYQYAVPHAGIPADCASCSRDLIEHQSLHLVFHTRCRFCRQQMRPFDVQKIVDFCSYQACCRHLKHNDDRTCSYCLKLCKAKYERKQHEAYVHEGKEKKFQGSECERCYSNRYALQYYINTHNYGSKTDTLSCNLYGSQFSSKSVLSIHKEVIHSHNIKDITYFECDDCGKTYLMKKNLNQHKKEKHFYTNHNFRL